MKFVDEVDHANDNTTDNETPVQDLVVALLKKSYVLDSLTGTVGELCIASATAYLLASRRELSEANGTAS